MLEVFSTREIASGIYLTLLLVWLVSKKDGAKAVVALLKTVFKPIIIIPVFCLLGLGSRAKIREIKWVLFTFSTLSTLKISVLGYG